MTTLAIAIAAAALALALAERLRLPSAPLAMLAGVALRVANAPLEAPLTQAGLQLAVTFLVFSMGTEIDRGEVARYARAAVGAAGLSVGSTAAVTLLLVPLLRIELDTAVYLTLALASSSTVLSVGLLRRRERFFEPSGRFVTGTLVAQDGTVVILLSIVVAAEAGPPGLWEAALVIAALAAAAWACGRWLCPWLLLRAKASEEERLLFVLALLFSFVGACWWARLPVVLGAYLAGAALARHPVGGVVRGQVASFSDFFTGMFFVLLGTVLHVPRAPELLAATAFVAAVVLLRPLLLLPVARLAGMTVRSSFEALTLLAQAGELGLIVVLVGRDLGHVDEAVVSIVATVVLVSLSIAPWVSADRTVSFLMRRYPAPRRAAPPAPPSRHLLVIGGGEGGRTLVQQIAAKETPILVLDDDPAVVEALQRAGVPALRGDGSDPSVLRAAGAEAAVAIVSTMRRLADNARLLSTFRGPPVLVRVFSETDADEIRRLGGIPIVESTLASAALVRWFESQGG